MERRKAACSSTPKPASSPAPASAASPPAPASASCSPPPAPAPSSPPDPAFSPLTPGLGRSRLQRSSIWDCSRLRRSSPSRTRGPRVSRMPAREFQKLSGEIPVGADNSVAANSANGSAISNLGSVIEAPLALLADLLVLTLLILPDPVVCSTGVLPSWRFYV